MRNLDSIARWLISLLGLIALIVVVGGVTRLTGSGLSMVDWRPVFGFLPPLSEAAWQSVFHQYQQFPQFQYVNHTMDLEGFKSIFFWEYLHRVLGRVIGLVALIPWLYFWVKGKLTSDFKLKGAVIVLWVVFQGLVGWYMVRSGLVDNPQVSHYRLALHLSLAFGLFAYIALLLRQYLYPGAYFKVSTRLKYLCLGLLILVLFQMEYGAFVAGMKAGYLYPNFPKMGSQWLASEAHILQPYWRNFFDNPFMVQFIHRTLGWLVLLGSLGIGLFMSLKEHTDTVFNWFKVYLGLIILQFVLGVLTLITSVQIVLAVLHQLNALFLITSLLIIVNFSIDKS